MNTQFPNAQPQPANNRQPSTNAPLKNKVNINAGRVITIIINIVIVAMLGFLTYLMFNPPFLDQPDENQTVLEEVAALTDINVDDPNIFVAQISDVEALREQNEFQSEVYAEAQNGDFAIAYEDKVIVYRRSENRIIYNDASPAARLQAANQQILENIANAARSVGINPEEDEVPQVLVVNDPEQQRETDPVFYERVAEGDLIAIYPVTERILIYRPDTESVINRGVIQTIIEPEVEE